LSDLTKQLSIGVVHIKKDLSIQNLKRFANNRGIAFRIVLMRVESLLIYQQIYMGVWHLKSLCKPRFLFDLPTIGVGCFGKYNVCTI